MQSGKASTSANSLNKAHFPSITGIPASGPISPKPRTAEPSVITATKLCLLVNSKDLLTSLFITRHGSATPGVYAKESCSLFLTGVLEITSILPCHSSCFFKACCLISILSSNLHII